MLGAFMPSRQRPTDGKTDPTDQAAEREHDDKALPVQAPGMGYVSGTDRLGDLHGIPIGRRGPDTVAEPEAGRHQADRSRCRRSHLADHRRIDILHQNGRDLRQNGRQAEPPGQSDLLTGRDTALL